MGYFPAMLLAVGLLIVILYVLEVHVGSTTGMYDSELGLLIVDNGPPRRSSRTRFWGRVVPIQLLTLGVPLLPHDPLAGAMLLMVAVPLWCLQQKRWSRNAQQLPTVVLLPGECQEFPPGASAG